MSADAPNRPGMSSRDDPAGYEDVAQRPRPTPRDALIDRLERLDVVAAQQDLQRACWEEFRQLAGLPEDGPSGAPADAERIAQRRESPDASRRLSFTHVRRPYRPLPQP